MKLGRLAGIALLLGSGSSTTAHAGDTNYHDYPLGARAVGLGGAYAAIADDPSGLYYNPAGLVDSTRSSVQVSTNLYGLQIEAGDNVFDSVAKRVTNFDTVFADLNIIPSAAGAVSAIGPLDAQGRPRHAYAIGAFVPSYRSVNVETIGPGQRSGERIAYRRNLLDRTLVAAAAYSLRIDETWRFGVSGQFLYRTLRDQEETSTYGAEERSSENPFNSAQTNVSANVGALMLSVGVKARLADGWFLGVNVTTPSAQVYDTATLRVTRSSADPEGGRSTFQLDQPEGIRASTKEGAAIRLGVARVVSKRATIAADAVFHAPVRYSLITFPETRAGVREAVTLTTDIEREPVLNLNLGYEVLLQKDFSVSVGGFTNFSSAPKIPGAVGDRFDRDYLPNVSAFGGALVLGFFSDHTLTRAGLTATFGDGEDVIAQNQELQPLGNGGGFKKIRLRQIFVFVFIASTFRY